MEINFFVIFVNLVGLINQEILNTPAWWESTYLLWIVGSITPCHNSSEKKTMTELHYRNLKNQIKVWEVEDSCKEEKSGLKVNIDCSYHISKHHWCYPQYKTQQKKDKVMLVSYITLSFFSSFSNPTARPHDTPCSVTLLGIGWLFSVRI